MVREIRWCGVGKIFGGKKWRVKPGGGWMWSYRGIRQEECGGMRLGEDGRKGWCGGVRGWVVGRQDDDTGMRGRERRWWCFKQSDAW